MRDGLNPFTVVAPAVPFGLLPLPPLGACTVVAPTAAELLRLPFLAIIKSSLVK
jgi:hypothetical protein